jgi:hypothetical protein
MYICTNYWKLLEDIFENTCILQKQNETSVKIVNIIAKLRGFFGHSIYQACDFSHGNTKNKTNQSCNFLEL